MAAAEHTPRNGDAHDESSDGEPVHRALGLTDDELDRIRDTLGREPNHLELAMYSVMWSEHCSYKSSRIHLRRFPTEAPWVLVGPGEGAGVVDVGDGIAAALRGFGLLRPELAARGIRHVRTPAPYVIFAYFNMDDAQLGGYAPARIALRRGVAHQRQLDAENPEYAEYRLYLVRLLRALGDLPGEDAARAEAQRLARELLQRDPQRAQYQAEVC